MRFRVVIPYVEPTHAVHSGRPVDAAPFLAEYVVEARSEDHARAQAREQFETNARDSGVGWIREPLEERITVKPA